eukprot:gene22875-27645_t
MTFLQSQRAPAAPGVAPHSFWQCDSYAATEKGRNTAHKALVNTALALSAKPLFDDTSTALVLDGSTGGTTRALLQHDVCAAEAIFIPNPNTAVVQRLRASLGVTAFASRVEGYIFGRPAALPPHRLVFLDFTGSVQTNLGTVERTFRAIDPRGGVLAVTFSARGEGRSWSRAEAIHTAISNIARAAREHGFAMSGLGAEGFSDYILCEPTRPSITSCTGQHASASLSIVTEEASLVDEDTEPPEGTSTLASKPRILAEEGASHGKEAFGNCVPMRRCRVGNLRYDATLHELRRALHERQLIELATTLQRWLQTTQSENVPASLRTVADETSRKTLENFADHRLSIKLPSLIIPLSKLLDPVLNYNNPRECNVDDHLQTTGRVNMLILL